MSSHETDAQIRAEDSSALRAQLTESLARERRLQEELNAERAKVAAATAARESGLAELRAGARLLNSVLDNMGHGLAVFDAEDRLIVHNGRYAAMYGLRPDEVPQGVHRDILRRRIVARNWPDDPDSAIGYFEEGNEATTSEIPLPDGSVYERVVVPRPDGGCVTTHTDVTGRKRVEADLREQGEILQDVFDNVAQGLAAYDGEARVITWNRKYQEFLLLADDQIYPGCPVWDLVMLHAVRGTYGEGDRKQLEERVRRRIDQLMSGRTVHFDYVNAKGIQMEAVSAPRPQGGFVVTYADITERKRAEAEIIRARDEAEAANRAKSSFLAAMSHEIRTPMNGVLGLLEVLQNSNLTDDQRALTRTIGESATTLLHIIDDILDFSKIEAGRMELEAVAVPLRRTVEAAIDTLAAAAEAKGLDITLAMADGLPGAVVGDPVRLRQILLNLLGNAVKFTERGTISVAVEGRPAPGRPDPGQPERTLVSFAVTDTGLGISAAQQAALFQPFSQAEATTTRKFGGTGLGLSICRRLVDLMGGGISVGSAPGAGSTFSFAIPFEAATVEPRETVDAVDLSGAAAVVLTGRPALDGMIAGLLGPRGVRVTIAATPDEAIAALDVSAASGGGPGQALMLVDDRLPVVDVTQVLWRLQGRRAVLIRGAAASEIGTAAAAAFSTVVNRPVHRAPLLRAVAVALGRASPEMPATPREAGPAAAPDLERPAGGRRILVAEDNAVNRLVVNRQLAALGCQADYAVDGRDAFALWQANTYDLLLSDCHMPNVDGFALTRLIREAESGGGRHTPIVALTANALVGESERCLAAGMDDYLAKPVTLKQMGAMLRRWLGAAEPVDEEGPPVADAGTPAIDATRIEEFFGDADPAFLAIVLEQFTDAWATSAGEIAKAVETRNAGLLGTAAHRAAGSAAAVCAAGLSETLKDLERAATEADWAAAERLAALLPAQAQATEHDLRALAAGTHRDGSG